ICALFVIPIAGAQGFTHSVLQHLFPSPSIRDASGLGTIAGEQSDPQNTGSVNGTVVDQSGVLIGGVQATLTRDEDATSVQAISDDDGRFFFVNLRPGAYHLSLVFAGLTPQQMPIELHPNQALTVPRATLAVAPQVTEVRVGLGLPPIEQAR